MVLFPRKGMLIRDLSPCQLEPFPVEYSPAQRNGKTTHDHSENGIHDGTKFGQPVDKRENDDFGH